MKITDPGLWLLDNTWVSELSNPAVSLGLAAELQTAGDPKPKPSFPIVCVGLSAGGIAPLVTLFRELNPRAGMAYVVIHHRKTPTQLPAILASCTKMPVQLASNALKYEPDHVYVLPSGMEAVTQDGHFSVQPRTKTRGWNDVFTLFLNSLSESRHPGIAVVLSGVDGDGAAALRQFQSSGGITIVQAPASSEQDEMPLAAIGTDHVDYVLPPGEIARQLTAIGNQLQSRR